MKKTMMAAVTAAVVLTTGSAFAAEEQPFEKVTIDGTASYRYRSDTNTVNGDKDNNIYKFILNAKTKAAKNVDIYARLGVSGVTSLTVGQDYVDTSKHFVAGIDQYGINYSNAGWNYKVGRQDAYIGATSLLYSSLAYVGPESMVDGVRITGKTGATNIDFIAAQEAYRGTTNDNRLYAVRGSYSPAKDWTVGATLGRYDYRDGVTSDTNHWAVDASYATGKATIFGEYGKSNADTQNSTYDLGVNYGFDKKNSAYVIYYNNGVNGDMGSCSAAGPGGSDFEPGYKGFYYGVDHKFTDTTSLGLFYRDMKSKINSAEKDTSFRATVSYKF